MEKRLIRIDGEKQSQKQRLFFCAILLESMVQSLTDTAKICYNIAIWPDWLFILFFGGVLMNFQGKAVLVYLEEDNIARAYFRVQPLMTQDGPVGSMAADYPDDGFLRIVPDKNEQHTFKERMRTLIGLCLVDLRCFSLEANKIRTNKNYSPSRGENNQYIVYSDAVRALPED